MRFFAAILILTLMAPPAQAIMPWQVTPSHVTVCAPFCSEFDVNYPGYVHGYATPTHDADEANQVVAIESHAESTDDYDSSATEQETKVAVPFAEANASVSRSAFYGCLDTGWEVSCYDDAQETVAGCAMHTCFDAAYRIRERDQDAGDGGNGYQFRDATITAGDATITHHDEWVNNYYDQRSCRDVKATGPLAVEFYDCHRKERSGSGQVAEGRETGAGSESAPISARVDWYPSTTDVTVNGETTTVPV